MLIIAFLSGAYKNAGDFLIEERAKKLLLHIHPDAVIERFLRNQIEEHLEEINRCDAVVFGGGPIYMKDLNGYLPLDLCIKKMNRPIVILGGGWYGSGGGSRQVSGYRFTSKTLSFLEKILQEGGGLSCRDIITYQILKNHGINTAKMTGCPAWYDLDSLASTEFRSCDVPQNIIISDPAQQRNLYGSLKLVDYITERFPAAQVTYAFHRGTEDKEAFLRELAERPIRIADITGHSKGFDIYDSCDLHIGYRVHAHIYNLSVRNRSVLIEEDGRGAGVNQALGLPQLKARSDFLQPGSTFVEKVYRKTPFYENSELIRELDSYLDVLEETDYQYIRNAFRLQQSYYRSMRSFIESIRTMAGETNCL